MTIKQLLAKSALLFLCVLFTQIAFSQTKTVSGKVLDDKGNPIQGATVSVRGSKTGTSTDAAGSFSFNVAASAKTLLISSVGFTQQEVAITDGPISVSLVASSQALTDVVVIGYGTARKKDLTGAVASVQAKDFNKGIVTSPDQLLQSKVPGLEVTNTSGQPGAPTTVKIRGNNSIRSADNPLYVIDGVALDGRNARPNISLTGGFNQTPDANALLYINPNDIQQIDVLKDASSAAIYGSRGANGVIVITTKKAASTGTRIDVGASWSINQGYMKKFDVLNAGEFKSALHKYSLDTLTNSLDHGSSVDPLKDITQHTIGQNYNLAFSGGNDNGKYRASFLASNTPGFIKNNNLEKYIGTFSGTYKMLDKRLTIDFSLIAAHTNENIANVTDNAGSTGNLISAALEWNPTSAYTDGSGNFVFPSNGSGNPKALLRGISDVAKVNTFLGNISADYKIINGLDYKFLYSINQSNGQRATNIDGFLQGYPPISGAGIGVNSTAELVSQLFTHTLNLHTKLSRDLTFEALAGFEYWKSNYNNSSYSALGFNTNLTQSSLINIPYTSFLQDGKTQNPPGTYVDPTIELQSYFGRVNFNYLDKYYITGTFRADGSSKFGKNNKYGYFPSVGAKWNIANEEFLKDNRVFSAMSLRGSWGISGNQEFPAGASQEQYVFSSFNTAGQTNVANPNLKWEQTKTLDVGLDFGILNGRITGSVDYYNRNTTDILFQSTAIQPAPASIYYINLPGHLINKGVEIGLSAGIVQQKDFSWDLSFNIAFNKNTLQQFYAPGTTKALNIYTGTIDGQGVSGTLAQIITNNQPIDEFYLKSFGGFDQKGNQQIGANPAFAGDPNPHTIYGASTTLRFQKLSLVLNGGGGAGFLVYNNTATNITNISGIVGGRNIDKNAYNSAERPSSGVGASTRFLEKGNYFKLRNVSLSYNIGNVGQYVKNLNIFFSGNNLFVITKFSGFDPEVNIDKSSNGYPSRSIEYVPYPTARAFSLGLNMSL